MITTNRINTIWQWCCDAYSNRGRRLAFPKNTPPAKTYQWRYLEALANKFVEWGFDDQLCQRFIKITVDYAVAHRTLSKGLSIFFQSNILQVCYRKLQDEVNKTNTVIASIAAMRSWVLDQAGDRPMITAFLTRSNFGAYPNIVRWYQAGQLTELYLSLSKAAMAAIARLAKEHPQDRAELPSATKLFLTRSTFLSDYNIAVEAQKALCDDWRLM